VIAIFSFNGSLGASFPPALPAFPPLLPVFPEFPVLPVLPVFPELPLLPPLPEHAANAAINTRHSKTKSHFLLLKVILPFIDSLHIHKTAEFGCKMTTLRSCNKLLHEPPPCRNMPTVLSRRNPFRRGAGFAPQPFNEPSSAPLTKCFWMNG
jgi:hypothetical protein